MMTGKKILQLLQDNPNSNLTWLLGNKLDLTEGNFNTLIEALVSAFGKWQQLKNRAAWKTATNNRVREANTRISQLNQQLKNENAELRLRIINLEKERERNNINNAPANLNVLNNKLYFN